MNTPFNTIAYGFKNSLQSLAPIPVVAKRAPTTADTGFPIGQLWIFSSSNLAYVLTSISAAAAQWQLIESSGGSGSFSSLTVNPGPTNLSTVGNGAVTIGNSTNTGAITLSAGTGNIALNGNGNTVSVGTDAHANTVDIGSTTGAAATSIVAGTGNLTLDGAVSTSISVGPSITTGNITMGAALTTGLITIGNSSSGLVEMPPVVVSSATTTVVNSVRVGQAVYTGQTTASGSTITLTVTNTLVSAGSAILLTLGNLGTNDAELTVQQVKNNAGSFTVIAKNNGAAALNGNITITFWVLN